MPKGAVIFFVEDDYGLRKAVKMALEDCGHFLPLEAGSLREALDKVREAKALGVNVAIIDGSLDGCDSPGDGPMVAEALRKEIPGIKIISFSRADDVKWGDYNPGKAGIKKLPSIISSIIE